MTSYLTSAGANVDLGGLSLHEQRDERVHEYRDVTYKLWEDDAVCRDTARPIPVKRRVLAGCEVGAQKAGLATNTG